MNDEKTHLYANDSEVLQISHEEYVSLIEQSEEAKRLQTVKGAVLSDLQHFIGGGIAEKSETISEPPSAEPEAEFSEPEALSAEPEVEFSEPEPSSAEPEAEFSEPEVPSAEPEAEFSEPEAPSTEPEAQFAEPEAQTSEAEAPEIEKVSVEFSAEEPESSQQPDPQPQQEPSASVSHMRADISEVPPIKQGIIDHFNKLDESGRLFNVFKQYYTYLNEMCGGTVRVTMKDGFCSFWNYDEWEEFAFVDIFEGQLRVAVDPSYTDALKSLSLCEVPRLISNRRNVICVQIGDLNNVVLDVLAKAFSEVGMQVK